MIQYPPDTRGKSQILIKVSKFINIYIRLQQCFIAFFTNNRYISKTL